MRYFFYMVACLFFVGCMPFQPLVSTNMTDWQAPGPVNQSGTQMAGIQNHGTMKVYINSQMPGTYEAHPVAVDNATEPPCASPINDIKKYEGLSLKPYQDQFDNLHIGYGRNLAGKGITEQEAKMLLENDVIEARADLSENIFPGEWPNLQGPIKSVLVNMRYQLGPGGFRGFGDMIAAVRAHDWQAMAEEMKNSRWAEQTPGRAGFLIKIVEFVGRKGN